MLGQIVGLALFAGIVLWPTLIVAVFMVGRYTGLQIPELRHFLWQAAVTALVMSGVYAVAHVVVVAPMLRVRFLPLFYLVVPYAIAWMALIVGAVIPVKKFFDGSFGDAAILAVIGLFPLIVVRLVLGAAA